MGVEIRFAQALWMEQDIEPAASAVPLVVGDFDIFYCVGVDILFHGPQVEQHGGLEIVEEHAVTLFEAVILLGWDYKGGTVRVLEKCLLGRADMLLLLGPDEDKCIYSQQQTAYEHSHKCIFHTTFLV